MQKKKGLITIFIGAFLLIVSMQSYSIYEIKNLSNKNQIINNELDVIKASIGTGVTNQQISDLKKEIDDTRKETISAILANQVEDITKDAKTDQDTALALAKWVSSNIANREPLGEDEYGWYAYRSGLCGSRARLFVEMLKYKHIPASVFNMYNFGTVGGGHSCAQVFYNNKWHFFDVTYAGIFEKDGNVLSWDEIISNPEDAMKHLVVFESTLDRWGGVNDDPVNRKKVDNNERMHIAYTVESLKNSKSYGFYRGSDVKTLYPLIDWGRINDNKVEIGKIDKDFGDVTTDGVEKQISEQLGVALGTGIDTFHTTWEFKNCVPNKEYILKYYVYKSTNSDLEFWVKGNNANITSGSSFKTDKALVEGNQEVWQIEFIPKSESCSVSIGYDFRDANKLVFTDKIDIEEAK